MSRGAPAPAGPRLTTKRLDASTLELCFAGDWTRAGRSSEVDEALREVGAGTGRLTFDTAEVGAWNSCLLTAVLKLVTEAERGDVAVERDGLPKGVGRLIDLATAVPEREGARHVDADEDLLERIGGSALSGVRGMRDVLEFLGEATLSLGRLLRGRARFRASDLVEVLKRTGADALPIVSLISVLVGLILAFVGAVQLEAFGAEIFVAGLVGIAMLRVMGAVMTGVIMAGRTGAAFAAELGTMQVNEEIDALETLGISAFDFLVLPRMLALSVMMPLLCLYADFMGMLGGFLVAVTMLDVSAAEYVQETRSTVELANLWIGLVHGAVFGVLIALTGCMQGMRCGRSASAVGVATTSATVSGIVAIVVATAVITVVCNVLGL